MKPIQASTGIPLLLLFLASGSSALDENSNGFSDVWEQQFKSGSLLVAVDDDGDGFSNLKEAVAGTNPLDAASKPDLVSEFFRDSPNEFQLSFKTLSGKFYTIEQSEDLSGFTAINSGWWGDGKDRALTLSMSGASVALSPVRVEFWGNVTTGSISSLTSLPSFPLAPDGVTYLADPEAPEFLATGYGARIIMSIKAPESGIYQFYVNSGGPAELYFGNASPGTRIAEVLPGQTGLGIEEWMTYPNQQSAGITLTAGQKYYLELRYVSAVPSQHAGIAWSGPGLDAIERLNRDDLSLEFTAPSFQATSSDYFHDYDSSGQTGLIWPADSALELGISGMTGNAERVSLTGDQGDTQIMRLSFPKVSTDLYATWHFNMSDVGTPHGLTGLFFGNKNTGNNQEGPRINLEQQDSGASAAVRGGGVVGNGASINVAFNQTFRVEFVATINPLGFQYTTPIGPVTVAEDRFDLYVSNLDGTLVGSATGLTFRDGTLVEGFGEVAVKLTTNPNIAFDAWEITDGPIAGSGYLVSNMAGVEKERNFYRLAIRDQDQDNDGLSDWEELALAKFHPFLFFDAESSNGTADATALTALLAQSQGKPEIALYGTDAAAFESNFPSATPDNAEITITRSGALEPLSVKLCIAPLVATGSTATVCDGSCCMLIGSAGDEEAEITDYTLVDEDGNTITDTVDFEFGEVSKVLTLIATSDAINEYPETVNLAIKVSTDYDISTVQNGASIQIFDLPDHPNNASVFTGAFSQDGRAVVSTSGSGFVTAIVNGPRTEIHLWDEFSNLTSAQQDSHVHKSNSGNAPGDIIYAITETPGDDESDPLNGPLTSYLWDLTTSSGAIPSAGGAASKQTIIDSLFGQNSETPLYLNVHTVSNPAGEIWAFLGLSSGSISDPGDATAAATPGSAEYPQLSGELLEVEVRRFLNQATFGATDENVAVMLEKINTARLSDTSYHRHQAFSEWIDDQANPLVTPQTFLLDFAIASHFQHLKISGIYDPVRNPTNGTIPTPPIPTPWPSINRSSPIPEHWYLSANYPLKHNEENILSSSNGFNLNHFGPEDVLCADWQLKLNGRDQLRHKMGFALQQIVVTSDVDLYIRENSYGSANYRDVLNAYAFDHYRDVLGFVNWSPVMGHWLSSIKNQKAIDFDNDGTFDSYPDENLARENMQLFSIGLFDMWSDGTLKLNNEGLPKPTYTNADIQEFAKIITGQGVSNYAPTSNVPTWGGVPYSPTNNNFFASHITRGLRTRTFLYPMKMFGAYHSQGTKTFAGTTIDNTAITNLSQQGEADIESAIDWLAGKPGDGQPDFDMVHSHVSTPAFISKRLIQRFTTSNPSKDYLHRVATAFKNSEGDLGQTIKAILLDPEARNLNLNETTFGMKKSPLEAYQQMVRTLGGHTYFPLVEPEAGESPYDSLAINFATPDLYLENFGYPAAQLNAQERNVRFRNTYTRGSGTTGLQMDPAYQDTVFNFYLPDYAKGGAISDAGLVAPELQLATEPDIIRNINYFQTLLYGSSGQAGKYLGEKESDQNTLFGNPPGISGFDHLRLPLQALADDFYPTTAPGAAGGRTSESLADEALLDALDKRLTNGLFKLRYPYDATDNDDPSIAGADDLLKNPRELIIDAITAGYNNANDGSSDSSDRLNKFKDALYLLSLTSEYQIRK
ncbi:DUF1800 family protein [Haloferula sp.]|uniref:DUF1800 family protein n=1 Tax=Haloferula sp. TaxID=2497595 RepID=UPI003C729014